MSAGSLIRAADFGRKFLWGHATTPRQTALLKQGSRSSAHRQWRGRDGQRSHSGLAARQTGDRGLDGSQYGESHKDMGTALRRYVDAASDRARSVYGVTAVSLDSTDTRKLTAQIHAWVKEGFPVIATIPSAWGTPHTATELAHPGFSTHVLCFYSESAGNLTAMNPWGGFAHSGTDAYWQERLCYGQVWKIYKETDVTTTPTTTPTTTVPTGWKDNGSVLTAPNGVQVVHGFRSYVLENKWNKDNWPLIAEFSTTSIEPGNPSIGAGSRQDFRLSSLGWQRAANKVYVIWF